MITREDQDTIRGQRGCKIRYQSGGSHYDGVVFSAGRKWLTLESGIRIRIEQITELVQSPYKMLCDYILDDTKH